MKFDNLSSSKRINEWINENLGWTGPSVDIRFLFGAEASVDELKKAIAELEIQCACLDSEN